MADKMIVTFALEAITGKRQFETGMGISEVLPQPFLVFEFHSAWTTAEAAVKSLKGRVRFVRGYAEETCCLNGGAASDWSWFDWGEVRCRNAGSRLDWGEIRF